MKRLRPDSGNSSRTGHSGFEAVARLTTRGPGGGPDQRRRLYGRGNADTRDVERTDRPVINGVRLSGGTHWDNPHEWRSFKPQLSVNTRVATSFTSANAPERTAARAAVIVLALLGHYMQHPRRPALQRLAGEFAAARRLRELEQAVARVGEQIAEKREQIGALEAQLVDYARLEGELAESYARRIGTDQAEGRA